MNSNRSAKHSNNHKTSLLILLIVLLYIGLSILLPIRALSATNSSNQLTITTPPNNLPWPIKAEAAVGLSNGTILVSHGQQTPKPTASVAKLITALAVLKKYPLNIGQSGPTITINSTYYGYYTKYLAGQGSIVPVYLGEKLTEYQMLEAMLIPSGDNIADSLAAWAYGSLANYDHFANNYVKQLGLDQTTVAGDASGYLPTTTSTANNLIKLGSYIMANPVLVSINKMATVDVPNVGIMKNYDSLLGEDGIIGIKTGNSNQAGGVFLGAAQTTVNNRPVTLLTAVMGASGLNEALSDTVPLVISLENDFAQTTLVSAGEVLGEFKEPWGGIIQIKAKNNMTVYALKGQSIKTTIHINSLTIPSKAGTLIGTITSQANEFNSQKTDDLVLGQSTTRPSITWRLLNPTKVF